MKKILYLLVLFMVGMPFFESHGEETKPDAEVPVDTNRPVAIGTGEVNGPYFIAGGAIAGMTNNGEGEKVSGIHATAKPTEGSVFNINAVSAGEIDFGISRSDHLFHAVKGIAEWKDKGPQLHLRALFTLCTEPITLVAADDAGIKTIRDLKGKRVSIGKPGSSQRQNSIDILTHAGIDFEADLEVGDDPGTTGPSALLQEGRIDAFFWTERHPNEEIKAATAGKRRIHFVPIPDIDGFIRKRTYYVKATVPAALYPGVTNKGDVETVGVRATLVSSARVPSIVGFFVTKAIFENFESLMPLHPAYHDISKEKMLDGMFRLFHPGAYVYYRKNGLVPSCCGF